MKSSIDYRKEILNELQQPTIFIGVSNKNWNILADMQAAAYILSNLSSPESFIKLEENPYKNVLDISSSLNTISTSHVQKMEDLSRLYIAAEYRNSDIENKIFTDTLDFHMPRNEFVTDAYYSLHQRVRSSKVTTLFENYALDVLNKLSDKIGNGRLSRRIKFLVNSYGKREHTNEKEICTAVRAVLNKSFYPAANTNYSNPVRSLIEERIRQILPVAHQEKRVPSDNKEYVRQ